MSGSKCQCTNCGKSKEKCPDLRMHCFPNDERKNIWIMNSGISSLVSAVPYEDKSEVQPHTSNKKNYNQNFKDIQQYIPHPPPTIILTDSNSDIKAEVIDPSYPSYTNTCTDLESDIVKTEVIDPSYLSYTNTCTNSNSEMIKTEVLEPSYLIETDTPEKLNNERNNFKNLLNTHNFPSINSKAIVTMQLKRSGWTLSEIELAVNIYYKSPQVYIFLYSQKINLPGPSHICRWIKQSKSKQNKSGTCSNSDIIKTEELGPSYPSYLSTCDSKFTDKEQIPILNLKRKYDSIETDRPEELKNQHNNLENLLHTHNFLSTNSKAIVTMQLKEKDRPWTLSEKELALNIYHKSPKVYTFLITQKINLPGLSLICHWVDESK